MALFQLLKNINNNRYRPTVACFYNGDRDIALKILDQKVPVFDLGMSSKLRVDAFGRLLKIINQEKPAILHNWLFHANVPGRIIGKLAKVPIIISSERTMGMEPSHRYWLNRSTSRWTDRIICVSKAVATFVESEIGISSNKTVVIPNGIGVEDLQSEQSNQMIRSKLGLMDEKIIIGTVARLDPVKKLDVLIQSISVTNDQESSVYVIVGEGPERKSLEVLIAELGLTDRIFLVGHQDDAKSWISAFNIFVLSSQWEGMPNVLLEAMAAGKPVVATRVGGIPEVVVEGETGLLVPPGDPGALANAISEMLSDPDRAKRMGEVGRQRVIDQFDIKTTVKLTEALYDQLLEEKLGQVYEGGVGWVKNR